MRTMVGTVLALALVGCSGPQQNRYAETPTARTRATPAAAPAASTSDRDREQLIQEFDDMRAGQQVHEEAKQPGGQQQPAAATQSTGSGPPGTQTPKKIGPAEQAPMPPKK
jgi:hypothetical protein